MIFETQQMHGTDRGGILVCFEQGKRNFKRSYHRRRELIALHGNRFERGKCPAFLFVYKTDNSLSFPLTYMRPYGCIPVSEASGRKESAHE